MKVELALLTLLTLAGTALFFQGKAPLEAAPEDIIFTLYKQWKSNHGVFTNGKEDSYRFAVFAENYKLVQKFNAKNNFKLGVTNLFAAMTNEEFRSMHANNVIRENQPVIKSSGAITADPTQNVDWVKAGAVNAIKDQGQCGSCWAFSATSQLEGWNQINSGNLISFSDQQVTSCTPAPSLGCNGGYPEGAMSYAASKGLMTDKQYPYTSGTTTQTGTCNYVASESQKVNTGYGNVSANDPESLYAQLEKQPISILVDAGNFIFQLYTSGIMDSTNCGTSLDHAISLTGFTTGTTPYWTVRNSWGTVWGMSGYAQIAYTSGPGICGINMSPSYPTGTV